MKIAAAALALLVAAPSLRQEPEPRPPVLEDLAWLAGTWHGAKGDIEQEELWLSPKGGVLLGLHRDVNTRKDRAFFEYLRIERRDDGSIHYVAKPSNQPEGSFALVSAGKTEAVFEDPEHDFPQRIRYVREGDVLRSTVSDLAGTRSGTWEWKRVE